MSFLAIGTKCTLCHTQDFLPLTCPSCHDTFCSAHISSHPPCTSFGSLEVNAIAGPSSFRPRHICQLGGCGRVSIEGIAGREQRLEGQGQGEEIAKEVRCFGCGGSYCVEHRAQISHLCTAPLAHQVRHNASIARKERAQAVLAKTFPDQAGRIIPKPPPGKDDSRRQPQQQSDAPALDILGKSASNVEKETVRPVKTKEAKLWEMQVRKVRSLAMPLTAGSKDIGERRFFEYGLGKVEDLKKWEVEGKWTGKVDRVWVSAVIPVGRILDSIITSTKTPRQKDPSDPTQALSLILISSQPGIPRRAIKLDPSQPTGKSIPDGTTVVLCRGWIDA